MTRVRGFTISCMTSRSIGEFTLWKRPGMGEYGMPSMCCSAHCHTGNLSGGVNASRHRFSKYSLSLPAIVQYSFQHPRRELAVHQPQHRPSLQGRFEVLLGILDEPARCQVPPPVPHAALDFHQHPRGFPRKVRTPAARFVEAVLPHQLRPTERIPHGGKPVLQFRYLSLAGHTFPGLVKKHDARQKNDTLTSCS